MLAEFHEKKLQRGSNLEQSKELEEKKLQGLQKQIKLKQNHLLQEVKEWADHQENLNRIIEEKRELKSKIRQIELLIDLKHSDMQLHNMKKESELNENRKIQEFLKTNQNLNQLLEASSGRACKKIDEENELKEDLEVKVYENTVATHTFNEDSDNLLIFLEEFIKKVQGNKAARDVKVFKNLSPDD